MAGKAKERRRTLLRRVKLPSRGLNEELNLKPVKPTSSKSAEIRRQPKKSFPRTGFSFRGKFSELKNSKLPSNLKNLVRAQILNSKLKLQFFKKRKDDSLIGNEFIPLIPVKRMETRRKAFEIKEDQTMFTQRFELRMKELDFLEEEKLKYANTEFDFSRMIKEVREAFLKTTNKELQLEYLNQNKIDFIAVNSEVYEGSPINKTQVSRKESSNNLKAELEKIELEFLKKDRIDLEGKVKKFALRWIPTISAIELIESMLKLDFLTLSNLSEKDIFRIYSTLVHLPLFKGMLQQEILEIFFSSRSRTIKSGDVEYYKSYKGVYVVLRGRLLVGERKKLELNNLDPTIPLSEMSISPVILPGQRENVFFELSDGDYISKNIFNFFKQQRSSYEPRVEFKALEDVYILEVRLTEYSRPILEKYILFDFYNRLDFLSRHKSLGKLDYYSLVKLATDIIPMNKTYGEFILKEGVEPDYLYIIREGSITFTFTNTTKKIDSNWTDESKRKLRFTSPRIFDYQLSLSQAGPILIESLGIGEVFGGHYLLKKWSEFIYYELKVSQKCVYSALIESESCLIYAIPYESFNGIFPAARSCILDTLLSDAVFNNIEDFNLSRQIKRSWLKNQPNLREEIYPMLK